MLERRATDTKVELYHIKIDRAVRNGNDFYRILNALLGGYLGWRAKREITSLCDEKLSLSQIGCKIGVSRQAITNTLSKPNHLYLMDKSINSFQLTPSRKVSGGHCKESLSAPTAKAGTANMDSRESVGADSVSVFKKSNKKGATHE